MTVLSVTETRARLSALLVGVEQGEEVTITRRGHPVAKIVSLRRPLEPRKLGGMKGKIWISPDFDELDPG